MRKLYDAGSTLVCAQRKTAGPDVPVDGPPPGTRSRASASKPLDCGRARVHQRSSRTWPSNRAPWLRVYAAGGMTALAARRDAGAVKLLSQMKSGPTRVFS